MTKQRIKKIVVTIGLIGVALFVISITSLYFYGTNVSTEEITAETLEGEWQTQIIKRHPMTKQRIKKIVVTIGLIGVALFVISITSLYFYGTNVSTEEITAETLEGEWQTQIIKRHDQLAVQLYAKFDQPVEAVWQFVRNYEEYPDRLDYVVSAEVSNKTKNGSTLKLVTKGFPDNISETLDMRYEMDGETRRAVWHQTEGTLSHNDGIWEVTPTENGCFLKYTMCISYGDPVPDWLLHAVLRLYAREIVDGIKSVVTP